MQQIRTPEQLYGSLFTEVQAGHIFGDSKTFVDATPKQDPGTILKNYRQQRDGEGFDLKTFVLEHFELPPEAPDRPQVRADQPIRLYIDRLWDVLSREGDAGNGYSSLLPLPKPYIVPGGRFREIYYWDSYFTMLGLVACDRIDMVENMTANFAHLIDQVGFIPNGNRTYYCSRSQQPYFALMVELLVHARRDQSLYLHYLPQLSREYDFWMAGAEQLTAAGTATRRVIKADQGFLNRHWDDSDQPRQESYAEDTELAREAAGRDGGDLFRNIRAACESGWDFSSRWLEDGRHMASIRTSQVIPLDLNAILHKVEMILSIACQLAGDSERERLYRQRAETRGKLIQSLFFSAERGFFTDLLLPDFRPAETLSLAAAYPLFFNLATEAQANQTAAKLQEDFLKDGGWVTTLNHTGQQWDAPNGWAPLQWIVYAGLINYGFDDEALEGANRWVNNNLHVYETTGKLIEKYNVEVIGTLAGGGEYELQDGFGWTNGVLVKLMDELGL